MRNRQGPRPIPKPRLLLAAVLVAALLGACSNSEQPAPPQSAELLTPSHPDSRTPDPAVAWSERLCRALLPVAHGAANPPSLDASNLEGTRQRFHTYLRNQVEVLSAALTQIAAAGPAPVHKGPQVDQVLIATLSKRRDALAAGFAELDAVPRNQRDTLLYTLTGVTSLLAPTDGRTLLDLSVPIGLQSAVRQAPSCQALGASAGTTGSPAPPNPIR
ncbi:MAG: hypothetical protein M3460_19070 [Actinomycetota bacterium]|nr:hypothetical protein [Actinomycetota bacterium]